MWAIREMLCADALVETHHMDFLMFVLRNSEQGVLQEIQGHILLLELGTGFVRVRLRQNVSYLLRLETLIKSRTDGHAVTYLGRVNTVWICFNLQANKFEGRSFA